MNIKKLVFNNFGLKVTALFLALLAWAMISGKERSNSERTIDVNVEYFNVAGNIDVSSVRPEKARLTIRGTSKELGKLADADFKIKIDLKDVTEGTRLNYFTEDYLQYPAGVKLVSIHPRMIEIIVKEFVSREVPVRVRYKGELKPGIVLQDRQIVPEKVRIFGYKSQIEEISFVEVVDWVDLTTINESCVIRLPLKKSKDILKFDDADTIEIHLQVGNKIKEGTANSENQQKNEG